MSVNWARNVYEVSESLGNELTRHGKKNTEKKMVQHRISGIKASRLTREKSKERGG